jgi:o-succinylbenzoate synthase
VQFFAHYQPFRVAYGVSNTVTHGETFIYVRITAEDGTFGIGEAAPSIPFSHEDAGTALHILRTYLAPLIIGKDCYDLEAIRALMEQTVPGHSMAKAGVDIALYDLNARLLGVPVYVLLGGEFRSSVPLVRSIGISTTEQMVKEAQAVVAQGFTTIKVKIGTEPHIDQERVRAIRQVIGDKVRLRVDANQGCQLSTYMSAFRRMDDLDLEFIEQPLPVWDVEGLRQLCAALDTPILIDEGIYTPHDLMQLIRREAVDAVNIKVEKTGLSGGKRIAAIAESAGLPCIVGSMIETGVGTAAGHHFATATPSVTHGCEILSPAYFFDDDVIVGNPYSTLPSDCAWPLPTGAGLGVTLRPELAHLFDQPDGGGNA